MHSCLHYNERSWISASHSCIWTWPSQSRVSAVYLTLQMCMLTADLLPCLLQKYLSLPLPLSSELLRKNTQMPLSLAAHIHPAPNDFWISDSFMVRITSRTHHRCYPQFHSWSSPSLRIPEKLSIRERKCILSIEKRPEKIVASASHTKFPCFPQIEKLLYFCLHPAALLLI